MVKHGPRRSHDRHRGRCRLRTSPTRSVAATGSARVFGPQKRRYSRGDRLARRTAPPAGDGITRQRRSSPALAPPAGWGFAVAALLPRNASQRVRSRRRSGRPGRPRCRHGPVPDWRRARLDATTAGGKTVGGRRPPLRRGRRARVSPVARHDRRRVAPPGGHHGGLRDRAGYGYPSSRAFRDTESLVRNRTAEAVRAWIFRDNGSGCDRRGVREVSSTIRQASPVKETDRRRRLCLEDSGPSTYLRTRLARSRIRPKPRAVVRRLERRVLAGFSTSRRIGRACFLPGAVEVFETAARSGALSLPIFAVAGRRPVHGRRTRERRRRSGRWPSTFASSASTNCVAGPEKTSRSPAARPGYVQLRLIKSAPTRAGGSRHVCPAAASI